MGATIDLDSWTLPPVFAWLADQGGMDAGEMLKTFNSGVGMVLVVAPDRADALAALLAAAGETVYRMGQVSDTAGVAYTGTLL